MIGKLDVDEQANTLQLEIKEAGKGVGGCYFKAP